MRLFNHPPAPVPSQSPKRKKFYTGVALEFDVVEYVDRVARDLGWTRSLALNFLLRDYARRFAGS
jgi:hypothetical protein